MVFATEFDPREQSQRRSRLPQSRAQSALRTSTVSLQEISDLENRLKTESAKPRRVKTARSPHRPVNSNVVPLQVDGVAQRVQIDAQATLSLPQQPNLPLGLKVLTRLQQGSTAVTGLLVTAALVIYGSTAYVDRSTNQAIIQLDELQGEAQQLTSANESIKQSLAEQANRPDSGLEPYEAGDTIFVEPETPRQKLDNEASKTDEVPAELPGPLGY